MSARLTKKQQKTAVFRKRQGRRAPSAEPFPDDAPNGTDHSVDEPPIEIAAPEPAKRKRQSDEQLRPPKRQRLADGDGPAMQLETPKSDVSRLILFVGNLRYRTTKESILQHFSQCSPPPTVRLLTLKSTAKSKGCAFAEFSTRGALQQGLLLHHTLLDGRKINVELTAGGGGKSATRLTRLKERNAKLEKQRLQQQQGGSGTGPKAKDGPKDGRDPGRRRKPAPHPGAERRPNRERQGKSQRPAGGQRRSATGANAISVG